MRFYRAINGEGGEQQSMHLFSVSALLTFVRAFQTDDPYSYNRVSAVVNGKNYSKPTDEKLLTRRLYR